MERSVPNYGWLRCTIPFLGTRRGDGATKAASLRSAAPSCSLADTLLRIHFEVLSGPLAAPKWEGGGAPGQGGCGQKSTTLRQKLRGIICGNPKNFILKFVAKKLPRIFCAPPKTSTSLRQKLRGDFFQNNVIFQKQCHDFFQKNPMKIF